MTEYISREAAMEIVKRTSGDYAAAWSEIRKLPAADVAEVRHGRWKHNDCYESWADRYVCSLCENHALSDGDYRHELSNYCPNCGAKMGRGADK